MTEENFWDDRTTPDARGETDTHPSCMFWDTQNRTCYYEPLIIGCQPCKECPPETQETPKGNTMPFLEDVQAGLPQVPAELTLSEARENLLNSNTGDPRFWEAVAYANALMQALEGN